MKSNVTITRRGHILTANKYNSIHGHTIFMGEYDPTKHHHYFDSIAMFRAWANIEAGLDRVEFIDNSKAVKQH